MTKAIYRREHVIFLQVLKRMRVESGMTQAQCSAALGRPQSFMSDVERGYGGWIRFSFVIYVMYWAGTLLALLKLLSKLSVLTMCRHEAEFYAGIYVHGQRRPHI